jgi:hypothetical protein
MLKQILEELKVTKQEIVKDLGFKQDGYNKPFKKTQDGIELILTINGKNATLTIENSSTTFMYDKKLDFKDWVIEFSNTLVRRRLKLKGK